MLTPDQIAQQTPNLSNPNLLINGDFQVWQRATTQTVSGYFSDDRWSNGSAGLTTWTNRRDVYPLGFGDWARSKYYCSVLYSGSVDAGDYSAKNQPIEGLNQFSKKDITVSFRGGHSTGSATFAVEAYANFGTGGSPSAPRTLTAQKVAVGGGFTDGRYSVTLTIPDFTADTLGTDGNDALLIVLWQTAGSDWDSRTDSLGHQPDGTAFLSDIKVEFGTVATPFVARPIEEELALCQRYFEKSYSLDLAPGDTTRPGEGAVHFMAVTATDHISIPYAVHKRGIPSLAYYNPSTGAVGEFRNGSSGAAVGVSTTNNGLSGMALNMTSNVSAGHLVLGQWTADAEL